jgi:antitoxin HicB
LIFEYPVTLTPDTNGTILVTFKDVPEAVTFGESEDDALRHAKDALDSALSFYVDARQQLPTPSKPKRGQKTVSYSA